MKRLHQIIILIGIIVILKGCVAGAVVEVLTETVEAGVEITGTTVGKVVNVIVPGDSDGEED